DTRALSYRLNLFKDRGGIAVRFQTKNKNVSARFSKGFDPLQRISDGQVHFERKTAVRPHAFHQVGEEQEAVDVMTVSDVEVKPLGIRLNALDFAGEICKIGRPKRRRTFHKRSLSSPAQSAEAKLSGLRLGLEPDGRRR